MSVTDAQSVISISDKAVAKVKELLANEDENMALRVGVKAGGCSGYSYEMFFDSETREGDHQLDIEGVKFVVDNESAPLLKGATLEYKDGLVGAGFTINNPNATRSCGCGSSFS